MSCYLSWAYSEPWQLSRMEHFAKIINGLDLWQGINMLLLTIKRSRWYAKKNIYTMIIAFITLTLKQLKGREGVQFDIPCGFSKKVSSKGRVKPWLFVTFNIIISHIFPKIFIEIPQVVQKIWIISLSILAIFIDFHWFFGFSDISLLQRN